MTDPLLEFEELASDTGEVVNRGIAARSVLVGLSQSGKVFRIRDIQTGEEAVITPPPPQDTQG